jgi:hypothetical protein
MADKMNIYQRINEVRKSIAYVQKDKSVSTGGGSYKAVTHDQVTAMVREHMVKHGIVTYPVLVDSVSNPKEGDAKQFRYEATYDFVFVNVEEPQDTLTIRIQAHAMDNADKAPGKALSYAKKYAILKLFEIETGEDDESRYQDNSFDFQFHIKVMNEATTLAELQDAYLSAKEAATKAKDSAAIKSIASHKDTLKAKLS